MTPEATCLALLAAFGLADDPARLAVCVAIHDAALHAGEDPVQTAAQAGIESRWNPAAVSPDGCVGPLQILPRYRARYCAAMGEGPDCDDITAGLGARRRWREWGRRVRSEWLCGYAIGVHWRGQECDYSRAVMALAGGVR